MCICVCMCVRVCRFRAPVAQILDVIHVFLTGWIMMSIPHGRSTFSHVIGGQQLYINFESRMVTQISDVHRAVFSRLFAQAHNLSVHNFSRNIEHRHKYLPTRKKACDGPRRPQSRQCVGSGCSDQGIGCTVIFRRSHNRGMFRFASNEGALTRNTGSRVIWSVP